MSDLIPFQFHTHPVRILPNDDGTSFIAVAKDVTDVLGYLEAKDGLRLVPDHHKGRHSVPTPGGNQQMLCVDEPGLYRLVLRSNKPEAEPFMEWVTSEVLPTIRRTGAYAVPGVRPGQVDALRQQQLLETQTELVETQRQLIATHAAQRREIEAQAKAQAQAVERESIRRNYALKEQVSTLTEELEYERQWRNRAQWALGPMEQTEYFEVKARRDLGMSWTQISRDWSFRSPSSLASQFRRYEERVRLERAAARVLP